MAGHRCGGTTLITSIDPSVYGQAVTFTATVTASSGTPMGKVRFENGGSTLGIAALPGGVATVTTTVLGVGSG